ncbi:hypothetical protein NUITMVA1_07500 [Aeromonas hydrophila]|nr:hypothetical protein NUITMVA1_07500 [Aeromonas hydrophila]
MQRYEAFYPGQVVKLSGGGYPMTVKPSDEDDRGVDTCCVWFNLDLGGEPIEYTFPTNTLKLQEGQEQYGYPHTRFTSGEVVKLRSGGPSMTVHSKQTLSGVTLVTCIWQDKKNREPLKAAFPSEMLVAE